MDKNIIGLISKITSKVLELNSITEHDFSIEFAGHVDALNVRYIEGGYKENGENKIIYIIDEYSIQNKEGKLNALIKILDDFLIEEKVKKRTFK